MQATIKSIHLENFKDVKQTTYEFNGQNITISGENGAGKTTIAEAYLWCMADKNYELASNPNIRPLGVEECTPRVEIVFDIDGKEITAAKFQKCTVKKSKTGGADTVSLSNSYEANSVEYGERDFKKKMQEYGFDFDLFLPLSHTDVFTGQKAADMRKVLFCMASEKTDKEIADMTEGAGEVAELLENYTAEEVKAMQNATLRKIKEDYGKSGEILRAKIEGMENSKVDIDVAELELHRNLLKEQIAENKAKQEDISKQYEEYEKLSNGVLELQFELNGMQQKANADLEKKRRELQSQIDEQNGYLFNIGMTIQKNNREIAGYEQDIESGEKERQRLLEQWKKVQEEEFDEQTEFCPTCGRRLPEDEVEDVQKKFEQNKKARLSLIEKKSTEVRADIDNAKEMIPKLQECNKDNLANKEKLEKEVAELENQLSELPQSIDISDRKDVQEIKQQIAEKEAAMNKGNSADAIRQRLKDEDEDLQSQLTEVEKEISKYENNVRIDEQIGELREKQKSYEQQRADAERILDQLDMVSKRKNELLTEEINKHFKLVKFRMFDYLKNGSVVDDCTPTIDGKTINEHSNGALRVLAKLDILSGLQEFYNQHYPVFADDYSLVTGNTDCRIQMNCQLIKLKAVEGVKKLQIVAE